MADYAGMLAKLRQSENRDAGARTSVLNVLKVHCQQATGNGWSRGRFFNVAKRFLSMSSMMSSYHKVLAEEADDLLTGKNDAFMSDDEDGTPPPASHLN
eukprot:754714-Hanusia_phi.AAC.1